MSNLNLEGMKNQAMENIKPSISIEYLIEESEEDVIEMLNKVLSLEEGEIVLDYRYIEGEDLEIFTGLGEKYYKKTYKLIEGSLEKINEEEVEFGKGGLKIKE